MKMKIVKKITIFFTLILSILLLVACDEEVDETLNNAYDSLSYKQILGENEDENNIISDLNLIKELGDVTITWESNNLEAITNEGKVNRLEEDTEVKLKATLKYLEDKKDKSFNFKVLKKEIGRAHV